MPKRVASGILSDAAGGIRAARKRARTTAPPQRVFDRRKSEVFSAGLGGLAPRPARRPAATPPPRLRTAISISEFGLNSALISTASHAADGTFHCGQDRRKATRDTPTSCARLTAGEPTHFKKLHGQRHARLPPNPVVGQASCLSGGTAKLALDSHPMDASPDRRDACPTTASALRFGGSKRELSVGKILTLPSPRWGERVASRRVRGPSGRFLAPLRVQCGRSKLSPNRSAGVPADFGRTQAGHRPVAGMAAPRRSDTQSRRGRRRSVRFGGSMRELRFGQFSPPVGERVAAGRVRGRPDTRSFRKTEGAFVEANGRRFSETAPALRLRGP